MKPNSRIITQELNLQLKKIVNIPEGLSTGTSYDKNSFTWEMITPEKEVVGVNFDYDPAYPKYKDKVAASLEMAEGGDPAIFDKALPALVADENSLRVVMGSGGSESSTAAGLKYSRINVVHDSSGRVIKVIWDISKSSLKENRVDYSSLSNFPDFALRHLYSLYDYVRDALKG